MGFEYVILVMQFLMLYIVWKTRTSRPVLPSPEKGALPSSISGHTLVRVWKKLDGEYDKLGWWWECSCGAKHPGSEVSSRYYGNESNALDTFKSHAKLYVEFAVEQSNPLEKELNKVKEDYAEYREKCYCKDANDDLLLMKKEGKWD
jgi:hypothetical protein